MENWAGVFVYEFCIVVKVSSDLYAYRLYIIYIILVN